MVFLPEGEYDPPDPVVLAQRALGELRLAVPDIQMAPGSDAMSYVGLETWLWMPSSQWRTLTRTVAVGGTSVTVTAAPQTVQWDMGAGSTTCFDPGKPWVSGRMPADAATTCQYVYDEVSDFQPNRRWPVTATITYAVDWTCDGACAAGEGTLGQVDGLPGTSSLRVGERQSVNVTRDESANR